MSCTCVLLPNPPKEGRVGRRFFVERPCNRGLCPGLVIEVSVQRDHIHMVIVIPPRIRVARVSVISKQRVGAS